MMLALASHVITGSGFGCPFLCNTDGPGTPFATPLLRVADLIRLLSVIGGVFVVAITPYAMQFVKTSGQWARFVGVAMFVVALTNSNAHHFGDDPNIGSVLGFVGVAFCVYGLLVFLREGRRSEQVPPRERSS